MFKDIFMSYILPGIGTMLAGVVVRYIHAWTKKLGIEMTVAQDAYLDKLVKEGIAKAEEAFAADKKGSGNALKQAMVVEHVQNHLDVPKEGIKGKTGAILGVTPGVGATADKVIQFDNLSTFSPKGL